MSDPGAYFTRIEGPRFLPQPACGGAWNPEELHVSPVNGLVVHELLRWLAGRGDADRQVTRISLDYLGVIDFGELDVGFEVLRAGRSIELVEAVLQQHGRPVMRVRVWRLARTDTTAVEGGAQQSLAAPETAASFDPSALWPGGYITSLEARVLDGPHRGRCTAWMTTEHAIVAGEPVEDLARFVLLTDTANGIAVRESPEAWHFPNVDLTIHLFRQPVGSWTGFSTHVTFGPAGHGLTTSALFDAQGQVGRAEQALLVCPRA